MKILNFACVECSEARDRHYPLVTFESITEAYNHAIENKHKVVVIEDEDYGDEE